MTSPTARRRPRAGLSWAEVLVIALIIGTLAAVALPVYLGYPRAAKDAATEADAADLGLIIRTAFREGRGVTSVTSEDGWYSVDGEEVLEVSPGVELVHFNGGSAETWCIELRHPDGDMAASPGIRYLGRADVVEQAACPSA